MISDPWVRGNVESVNLISNLGFSMRNLAAMLEGFVYEKLAIVWSFHPSEVRDTREWIETARFLNGISDFAVVIVAHPPVIGRLASMKAELTESGLTVFVQSFRGRFGGRSYPEAYTETERRALRDLMSSEYDYEYTVNCATRHRHTGINQHTDEPRPDQTLR